jgi:NitT/TauT family transport system ATP-binding protein
LSNVEAQRTTSLEQKIILNLNNVSKVYHENNNNRNKGGQVFLERSVLDKVNLDIREGEFITIVGPSGCGKSALLNIAAGIDTSYGGPILIDGQPISKSKETNRIVIFQEGALFPWLTVCENVEFGLKVTKLQRSNRIKIIMHYIDLVKLPNFANAFVHQLSGGMK